ncbi:hypothetical protein MIMGU_mgv1a024066mg [Erythranthe guttata]|uniref:F-box domain-containing protein n=1 Tax=Erythranthe guttata TaxID=4155 RepID=A0A022QVU5_ERYGU|nr:PREDICTED: F-box/kelch-repeat protein At3g23880-like [Erythranthe guttata]EYU31704.1 hypothetical protein MIMGU_mgv1a024066mg [Erythranthe guttata]|eukprot:XP_012844265.1 PREDICTED: F-box/kelch-repeat protein At3g23880-like [Erythranthe guttata]
MDLPIEIIEIVLLKLSVKPLLRFKSVCKSWNILISDPVFVRKHHLRQLQSKDSENLFLLKNSEVNSYGFSLVKFEKKGRKIQTLRQVFGPYLWATVLCFCEGLILISDISKDNFALWNPSTRTQTLLNPKSYLHQASYGLCRDPITADFKVVVVGWYCYSVYSCNNKSWVMVEQNYENKRIGYRLANSKEAGVCVDGASYWASTHPLQIVYYDPRDDKFKILEKPEDLDGGKSSMYLVELMGSLGMYVYTGSDEKSVRIWVKEKGIDNHSWKELVNVENVENVGKSTWRIEPQCLVGDKIVIRTKEPKDDGLVVYDACKKRFEAFEGVKVFGRAGLVPYMESLFFPVEKSSQVVMGLFGFPI